MATLDHASDGLRSPETERWTGAQLRALTERTLHAALLAARASAPSAVRVEGDHESGAVRVR